MLRKQLVTSTLSLSVCSQIIMERDAVPDVDTSIMQAPPGVDVPITEPFTGIGD